MSNDPYSEPESISEPQRARPGRFSRLGNIVHLGLVACTLVLWYFPLLLDRGVRTLNVMTLFHATAIVHLLGHDPDFPTFEQHQMAFWMAELTFLGLMLSQIRWQSLLLAIVLLIGAFCWTVFNVWLQLALHPLAFD